MKYGYTHILAIKVTLQMHTTCTLGTICCSSFSKSYFSTPPPLHQHCEVVSLHVCGCVCVCIYLGCTCTTINKGEMRLYFILFLLAGWDIL